MDDVHIPAGDPPRVAKMQGAGNDFCVLDHLPDGDVSALVRAIADRRTGIGADGVLFLERGDGRGTLRMHFYNADGGRAGLCLNGSRCVALRAVQLGWADDAVVIETDHQTIDARVVPETGGRSARVELQIAPPRGEPAWIDLPESAAAPRGARVDTGDPHLIVPVGSFDDFVERARFLRHHASVGPAGANVHFVDVSTDPWAIRSFERGVEDETLACGSGCVSAVAALGRGLTSLRTRRGDVLRVDPTGDHWTLEGPAALVFVTDWIA